MSWTSLVSAVELAAALGRPHLVLVDCRYILAGADKDAGERAWAEAHLPGAAYAHLDRDLSDHRQPPEAGRHPLPTAEDFCRVLVSLGVTPQSQVVAYDSGDGAMAARFWWLLKRLGHTAVAVLDGGFARWNALGLPLQTEPPRTAPGAYHAQFRSREAASLEEVERAVGEAAFQLLDARSPERFRGEVEPLDKVAGHIPGARNRPYSENLSDGCFRPAHELRAEFLALLDGRAPEEAILYCGSGVTACHNLLAMEYAGLHGARIFPPSWSGWTADPRHPIERGPATSR
jgi:thiosulfate/3-mercaptopyruvate sulfurtransferase